MKIFRAQLIRGNSTKSVDTIIGNSRITAKTIRGFWRMLLILNIVEFSGKLGKFHRYDHIKIEVANKMRIDRVNWRNSSSHCRHSRKILSSSRRNVQSRRWKHNSVTDIFEDLQRVSLTLSTLIFFLWRFDRVLSETKLRQPLYSIFQLPYLRT